MPSPPGLKIKGFHFGHLAFIVLSSEIVSAGMCAIMGIIWWGKVSTDLIMIGGVVSFVASSIVGTLILLVYGRLRESEARYRKLISDAGDGICIVNAEGNIIDVNSKLEELSGYSGRELLTMPFSRLNPVEVHPRIAESVMKRMEYAGAPVEVDLRKKDGSLLPVSITYSTVSVNGRTIRQAVIRDISEWTRVKKDLYEHRHKLELLVEERTLELSRTIWNLNSEIMEHRRDEESLRHARDFSEAILHSMHDAVAIINTADFSIAKANDAFCAMYAVPAEAEGQTCHSLIHGSSSPCFAGGESCPLRETLTTGRHASSEHVHFTRGGEMRYVEDSTSPVFDADGRIVQVVHITRDITGKTLMELALRESEERFRQIFAQDDDSLFVLDPYSHVILDANPCAVQTYGYTAGELLGKPIAMLFDTAGYENFMVLLRESAPDRTIQIFRMKHMRKDGSRLDVSLRGRVIRLKDRAMLYCSFRDMTEKFRLQEETRHFQARLIHTNKMTSLGTLVSGVAHEINNPNNFILFNAQLLAEAWRDIAPILESRRRAGDEFTIGGLPYEEMREVVPKLLDGIKDGSQRINAIVKNLKDFARQDRPDLDAPVDINEVVNVSAAIMESHIRKHTSAFSLELGSGLPAVRGSRQQLEQVVINLLMNALLSLTGPDGVVRVTTFAGSQGNVSIRVYDEGVGMTAEVMERITEPFYTTRLDQGGTGLGLSISYSIVKAHRGSIVFESEPGKGTAVTVSLPADKAGHDHA